MPKLEKAEVMHGVTGVYDMTPDSRPLLGRFPELLDYTCVRGFLAWVSRSRRRLGWRCPELILDGVAKTVDINAFRPQRFAEGKPDQSGV